MHNFSAPHEHKGTERDIMLDRNLYKYMAVHSALLFDRGKNAH
jgi:hypothetical protein